MTKDLQKQIKNLEKIANSDCDRYNSFDAGVDCGARFVAEQALLIIRELQEQLKQLKGGNNDK